jgi:hypothetical protein
MKILKSGAATALAWAWLIPPAAFGAATAVDYYQWALHCFQQKNYAEAGKYFHYALQVDPKDWKSLQMLGTCEALGGQAQEALEDYRKSLQINPSNPALVQYLKSFGAAANPVPETASVNSPQDKASGSGPNYVWDPAQDPYPPFTGPADPLPKTAIPIFPSVYLTASYGLSNMVFSSLTLGPGSPTFSPGIFSFGLHYQLDPLVSIALGSEIWPALSDSYSASSNVQSDSYSVTPVSLGLFLHSWGKGISFDAGASLAAFLFQRKDSMGYAYYNNNSTYLDTYQSQETTHGTELGVITQLDLNIEILPQNLSLSLTGKGYFSGDLGFGTDDLTVITTNPSSPTTPNTSTSVTNTSYLGSGYGLGIIGVSIGLSLQAGF